jgi:biopolymer transport protein ExbB
MFLLQAMPTSADTSAVAAPTQDTLSLLDLLLKGGYIMIPILFLSVISISVFIERYLIIKQAMRYNKNLLQQVKDLLMKNNLDGAKQACKNDLTIQGIVLYKGLTRLGKSNKDIESAMEMSGKVEISKLEKNTNILGILAGIAPMFGFIGTIAGVIKIFYNISLADNISIGLISGGLYEKMITSAAGLVVGVFSFVAYHYLQIMIDKVAIKIETSALGFMDIINETE